MKTEKSPSSKRTPRTARAGADAGKLREILDHIAQAVLVFGRDGIVEELHSAAARRIFGDDASGKDIRALLFDEQNSWTVPAQLFESWLELAWGASPIDWPALSEAALPEATVKSASSAGGEAVLELEFQPIYEDGVVSRLLLIATDVTAARRLSAEASARQTQQERELAAVRRLLGGSAQIFSEFLRTAAKQLAECHKVLDRDAVSRATFERTMEIAHTVQGEARTFDLIELAEVCEELTGRLRRLRGDEGTEVRDYAVRRPEIIQLVERCQAAVTAARDLFIQASPSGKAALEQTTVSISHLEELGRLVRGRADEIEHAVSVLVSRPFGDCAATIARRARGWAEADGKSVTVVIEGREVPVPSYLAEVLPVVLAQVVRHCVLSRIETPNERAARGKKDAGTVKLVAVIDPDPTREVIITIEDDGRDDGSAVPTEPAKAAYSGGAATSAGANDPFGSIRDALSAVGYALQAASSPKSGATFTIARASTLVAVSDSPTARYERALLALAGSSTGTIDWDIRTGIVVRGDSYLRFLGYTEDDFGDEVSGWEEKIHPDDRASVLQKRAAHLAGDVSEFDVEYRMLAKSGRWMWVRTRAKVVERDGEGRALRLVGTVSDVDAQHAEKERLLQEARFRGLENRINEIELVVALDGQMVEVNDRALAAYGYTHEEILKLNIVDLRAPRTRDDVGRMMQHAVSGRGIHFESEHCRKDGTVFPVDVSCRMFEAGGVSYLHSLVRDLTEQRRAEAERTKTEERLRAALHERDTLMKEVHHRVKNNLQMMVSLLALQVDHVTDPRAVLALKDSQQRLRSIALIHEQLYQAADLAHVNFALYARNVADGLKTVFAGGGSAEIDVKIGDTKLDVHVAIPCALILNELVSNSLKYAFPRGRRGTITIGLERDEADARTPYYLLEVRDDGVGLPEGFDPAHASTLGLKLVFILARQLGGRLTIANDGGARFALRFPENRESRL